MKANKIILNVLNVKSLVRADKVFIGRKRVSNANKFIANEFFKTDIIGLVKEKAMVKEHGIEFWILKINL